jgi:amidase
MYEQAREAAGGKLPEGPFTGVPFLLKDLLAACRGVPMTFGSRLLKGFVPEQDSELVRRLRRAGLVFLGRTNVPEFGLLPTTESEFFGPCRNPWDTGRSPGGSSGGSAAAVAAGFVPMAHGNDGGGSIRIPASCCGLFGLKPTRGRNPLGPDIAEGWGGLVAEHALTRTVRDSAALLDATAGPDVGDPYWAPPPAGPFLSEVGADPGRLKIAFSTASDAAVHPDCVQAVQAAAELCRELGHEVREAAPDLGHPIAQLKEALFVVMAASLAATLKLVGGRREQVEPLSWALAEMGGGIGAADYVLAVQLLQRASRFAAAFFIDTDVFLTPVIAEPPAPLGTFAATAENPLQGMQRAAEYAVFTPVANFTGQPAMSVPLHWNSQGLPVGVNFLGRFGDEATLFRLAAQLEEARPWVGRRPPI